MSMNAIHRSIMIFSDSKDKASEKLSEFSEQYKDEIVIYNKREDYLATETLKIQAVKFSESSRGYRYQKAYVDESLKHDDYAMEMIVMKLVPPSYYDMSRWGEKWDWRDHVVFFKGVDRK